MKRNRHRITKPPLRVADFICRRCHVQATRNDDQICGICKALGKNVEPPEASLYEGRFIAMLAEPVIHWFRKHNFVELRE